MTLIAVGGAAAGVTTSGLRWALDGALLEPGSTLGVSNEVTASPISISVTSGVLLVIHHGADEA